jgi:hypothetical protein
LIKSNESNTFDSIVEKKIWCLCYQQWTILQSLEFKITSTCQ